MNINIFGLGYVGAVSAACLAEVGHTILGVDIDALKVRTINDGLSPVVEPGLAELLRLQVDAGRIRATTEEIGDADVSMVCVGTPSNENGSLCLNYLFRVAEQIGAYLKERSTYHVVCIRSTVLPGTIVRCVIPILERTSGRRAGPDFGVCMNPEFLREGTSIADFHAPPFTVIGELDAPSGDVVQRLYASLDAPIIRTPLGVAEMVKYTSNAFHALKVTFSNEIGTICKKLGLDGREVMDIVCRDRKLNVSDAYLAPGFSFGGSCLPKDLRALIYRAREVDVEPRVLRAVLSSNIEHMTQAFRIIRNSGRKRVAVLGLSFKPGTDDLRESPIAELIELLLGKGHPVAIYDREVTLAQLRGANKAYIEQTIPHLSRLMKASIDEAVADAEIVVLGKKSAEFREVVRSLGPEHHVLDLAGCFEAATKPKEGEYEGLCW